MTDTHSLRDWTLPMVAVLVTHLLFLMWVKPAPISADAGFYHLAAERIADGLGYTGKTPHTSFMPGYPIFVGAIYWAAGKHPWLIRAVQIILLAVSAGLLALTAERLTNHRTARVAFFLLGFFPAWFIYPGTLNAETLLLVLEVLYLWTIARPVRLLSETKLLGWAAASGGVAGLLALVKPEFSLWLPAACIVALGQSLPWQKVARIGAVSALAFCVVLAPWVVRNARAFHRFIPFSTKVGAALWISGHRPEITEFQDPGFLRELARCEAASDPKQTDECMRADATKAIASHPLYFVLTSARRIGHTLIGSHTEYLNGFGISFGEAFRTRQAGVFAGKLILLLLNLVFVSMGMIGVVWMARRRRFWFVAYLVGAKLAIHGVLFGTPRYGLHLSPLFALAGASLAVAVLNGSLRPGPSSSSLAADGKLLTSEVRSREA